MKNLNPTSSASSEATSRYANILLDYWFKRSFGTESGKRLMILTLREILPDADISDITYGNKEHPNPFPDSHGVIFDIECTSGDGSRFIVEVQLARQAWFMERALFYSSFAIQEQVIQGRESYGFMPVYFIALMDFALHPGDDGRFVYRYNLLDINTGELMTDRISFTFLELPKVKSISDESSNLEKLCYALHNMTVLKSHPPEMAAEIFELLFSSAEIAKFSPEEKIRYEYDMTTERDIRNQIAYGREEGLAEGLEKGRAEGLEKGRAEGLEKGRTEGLEKGRAEGKAEERRLIMMKLKEKGFSDEEVASLLD